MSMGILWAPIEDGDRIATSCASHTWTLLRALCAQHTGEEVILDSRHIGPLQALVLAEPGNGAWPALVYALQNAGRIRVYTEV